MCTDWLVRTYLPLWFDAAGPPTRPTNRRAAAIATGTVDVEETIAVIAASGMVACCVELCVVRSGLGVAAWRRSR